ncbi:MAG: DNA recombination protein RmuC [Vicinamibacterales bacterium]
MLNSALVLLVGGLLGAAALAILWLRDRQTLVQNIARLQAERDAAAGSADQQRALLTQTQAQVRDTFAALSREALKENRSDFATSADALFTPVLQTLEKVRAQLSEVDKAREGSFRAVASQLQSLVLTQEQLRATTEGLSRSLRSPNVRGKWGEVQLRRILELAGMLEQCDFVEKESSTTAEGTRQTPDLLIKLPGGSTIVVDSKVPIDAYLASCNARTDAERIELLMSHARQVRDHVRALGAKEYWRQFKPGPEFVVMFMPLEPLLSTAFEHDGSLLEQAANLRVIPATPMTLLALLKAVAYGWQQQVVARNTDEIQELGRELYERLAKMMEHLEGVGRNIGQAAEGYNRFIGSLEQKVLPSARRFKELGVSSVKTIETPEPLDLDIRRVLREELIARPEEKDGQLELEIVEAGRRPA